MNDLKITMPADEAAKLVRHYERLIAKGNRLPPSAMAFLNHLRHLLAGDVTNP